MSLEPNAIPATMMGFGFASTHPTLLILRLFMQSFFAQKPAYSTRLGAIYCADSLKMLRQLPDNSVNLVMTSSPFALQRQKEYGNQ